MFVRQVTRVVIAVKELAPIRILGLILQLQKVHTFCFPPFFFVRLNLYIELLRILSLIVFFTFVSIFVNALGLDDAHYKVECSNMGTCDKTKGECKCRTNFEGKKTKLTHGSLYTNREQQAINTQHLSNTSLPFL